MTKEQAYSTIVFVGLSKLINTVEPMYTTISKSIRQETTVKFIIEWCGFTYEGEVSFKTHEGSYSEDHLKEQVFYKMIDELQKKMLIALQSKLN